MYEVSPDFIAALVRGVERRAISCFRSLLRNSSGSRWAEYVLTGVARFLRGLAKAAEQLTDSPRWARILAHAFRSWLGGRHLRSPPRLMAPA